MKVCVHIILSSVSYTRRYVDQKFSYCRLETDVAHNLCVHLGKIHFTDRALYANGVTDDEA